MWFRRLEGESVNDASGFGPSPVLVENVVIVFNAHARAFEAIKSPAEPAQSSNPALKWSCPVHRSELDITSSPVVAGSFLYFVTREPNYLHRICIDSGLREVCALEYIGKEAGVAAELPGQLMEQCPPCLVEVTTGQYAGTWICILTTGGFLFVQPSNEPLGAQRTLPAFSVDVVLGQKWSRPVLSGDYLIAVALDSAKYVLLDLRSFPACEPGLETISQLSRAYNKFTPCLALGADGREDTVIWWGSSKEEKKSQAIFLVPPRRISLTAVPYCGNQHQEIVHAFPPMTDGCGVYQLHQNAKLEAGLLAITAGHTQTADFKSFPMLPIYAPLSGEQVLLFDNDAPSLVSTFIADPKPVRQDPYADGRVLAELTAKPLVLDDKVFVVGKDFVSCYGISREETWRT
jgi:hypothetical protein